MKNRIFKGKKNSIKTRVLYLFWAILFSNLSVFSQDIHFSQFNGSLLNLTPGFTGFFNGDFRVGAIYRSQWQAVPVPYSTFSMNGEARLKPKQLVKDMVGVGLVFNSDRAGDTRYGTTQLYANGSYIFLGKPDSSLLVTLGMNLGWCQVGFDYDKMTFDNQYDGVNYSNTTASGENFDWTRYNYADINLGAGIQYILDYKHHFTVGLGFHHLNNPVITYQGNALSRLDLRMTNYLSYSTPINQRTDIIAEALISKQAKNYEIIPHSSLKYYFNRDDNKAVLAGICWRAKDAVVFRFGYTHKTLQSGIAYDINTSKFTAATNRRGAFEIFVNYVISRKVSNFVKKRVCPVFM
ncbi:MAG: PorP/SprF family type IX secretion system membrane protein [Bacteroidota bacterium]|nr:PorP/SprF family type IX secretion system membrane protein [Bacteroidota bacterium]